MLEGAHTCTCPAAIGHCTAVRLNPYTRYCQRRLAWGLIKTPRYSGYSQRRDSRSPILHTASGKLLWKQPSGCVGRIIIVVNVHFQLPFTFFLLSILNCITWQIFSHEQENLGSNRIHWLIWPHKKKKYSIFILNYFFFWFPLFQASVHATQAFSYDSLRRESYTRLDSDANSIGHSLSPSHQVRIFY